MTDRSFAKTYYPPPDLLRHALDSGFPVTGIDVEVNNGWTG
jgi:hypothetical protein